MNKPVLINVTCSNAACTKPLFALEGKKGHTLVHSFGALLRMSEPRLGVDRTGVAICPHCGAETPLEQEVVSVLTQKK